MAGKGGYVTKERRKEAWERAAKVAELLASGLTVRQIQQYATEKLGWTVTEKMIYTYIAKANEAFAEESKAKINEEFGKGLRRLNMLFAASLKIQDYKACLSVQREINSMMGFNAPGGGGGAVIVHGDINTQTNVTNQAIQIEYVETGKEIATSEDQVDLNRPDRIIELQSPQQTDNERTIDNLGTGDNPSIQNDPDATEKLFEPDVPSIF